MHCSLSRSPAWLKQTGSILAFLLICWNGNPLARGMELGANFWNLGWHKASDCFQDVNRVTGDNPWNPQFLKELAPYRSLRFMDWDQTNGSQRQRWSQRNPKSAPKQNPAAYEWMIDLCNRVQADLWVTLPHRSITHISTNAPSDYALRLCLLVKTGIDMGEANLGPVEQKLSAMSAEDLIGLGGVRTSQPLRPDLKLYLEYSNETWNGIFKQSHYCCDEGLALNLHTNRWTAGFRYHAWAAIRLFRAADLVFGADSPRVVKVLAGFTSNPWVAQQHLQVLADPRWNPWGVRASAIATAPYFGHQVQGDAPDAVEQLRSAIQRSAGQSERHQQIADRAGLKLIAYEGGQHVTKKAAAINRHPEMFTLYQEYLRAMSRYFSHFSHYNHVGQAGDRGAWGAIEFTGQPIAQAHKYRALVEWAKDSSEAGRLIKQAGNTEEEMTRLRLLRALAARPDLSTDLRQDLAQLLPVVEDWADGKARAVADSSRAAENGYLCRFIDHRVKPVGEGPVYPPAPAEDSPLRPLWSLYRGRMLIWRVVQSGPLLRVKASREAYYSEGRRLLEEARQAFPENRVIGMFLGEPIPWPKEYPAHPAAPAWANLQREGLEKLADVIHWWIAQRQLADGQFGGGWGDDVEMWRWWAPALIAFEDPVINAAQERISKGMFQQPHLSKGFTARLTDVEHANEDTTDTVLPMMHLQPDDPLWKERALRLAELMDGAWTGRNQRGFLQFKSIYFSVDRVDLSPRRAYDTVYHPSIVQPALLYWQRTGDTNLGKIFGEWLKVWVDAAARHENGKPAGVLPSVLRWPEGTVGAAGQPWWQPFSPGHNDALYNWPGATRLMTSTLLLAWHMTRDDQYLEPLRAMAALREKFPGQSGSDEPGSEAWCARQMGGFLSDSLAKYRFLTSDPRYDALLRSDASGYTRFRLTGDAQPLTRALMKNAEAFRSNWEAYTSEMRWTDRVMSFTRNYLNYLDKPAPTTPSPELLYSAATGDPGSPLIFPLNAVRWLTPPRELAALVTESTQRVFAAELFHFGSEPRRLEAEFYLLRPGEYQLALKPVETGADRLQEKRITIKGPRARVSFTLPPGRLSILKLTAE